MLALQIKKVQGSLSFILKMTNVTFPQIVENVSFLGKFGCSSDKNSGVFRWPLKIGQHWEGTKLIFNVSFMVAARKLFNFETEKNMKILLQKS